MPCSIGEPDPPVPGSLTATDTLEENDPPTSKIELRWIRGFDGGYTVTFRLYFREQGKVNFQQVSIGASPDNRYSLVGMKTGTTYEFTMRAVNDRGVSREYFPYLSFTTKSMSLKLLIFKFFMPSFFRCNVDISLSFTVHSTCNYIIVHLARHYKSN